MSVLVSRLTLCRKWKKDDLKININQSKLLKSNLWAKDCRVILIRHTIMGLTA